MRVDELVELTQDRDACFGDRLNVVSSWRPRLRQARGVEKAERVLERRALLLRPFDRFELRPLDVLEVVTPALVFDAAPPGVGDGATVLDQAAEDLEPSEPLLAVRGRKQAIGAR